MFQAKDLSEDQVEALKKWAAEGDQLADLQKKLTDEYSLNVTYMDMRFVVLDLNLEILSQEEPEEEVEEEPEEASVPEPLPNEGGVSVTVDQVTTPGSMVSGRVSFSDGESARWMIDEMGRPSLDPETAGYQPTHEDLLEFQQQLRKSLEETTGGLGY